MGRTVLKGTPVCGGVAMGVVRYLDVDYDSFIKEYKKTDKDGELARFVLALKNAKEHLNGNRKKYAEMRKVLLNEVKDYELINKKYSLDNFVVLCFDGLDAERLIYALEDRGVYVSTGAACAASKGVRSHVLMAIGLTESEIAGSLRITLGETNTLEQIHEAAKIINEVVEAEKARISG